MISYTDYLTTGHPGKIRYNVRRCHPAPAEGSVVLLSGRSEFIEKYDDIRFELIKRHLDVYSIDWRGQGLSSRPLSNRQKGYIDDFGTYRSDLAAFIRRVVLPVAVRPLICLSHSMGGHIVIRYLHDAPDVFDFAVLTSPMIDILVRPFPVQFARWLTQAAVKMGFGTSYALGESDYRPGNPRRFRGNPLTSDYSRYMDQHRNIAETPELAMGGVTYGWLDAAFRSIDLIRSPGYPEKIRLPMLVVSSGNDRVVSVAAQKALCRRMDQCRLVSVPGARHEILKEKDRHLNRFWQAFDGFFRENA